jgi:cytochrome d ubiquinol oxidase subunit II
VLCGIALVIGYALQGACWLVWRCEGALQQRARQQARILAAATLVLIVIVSVWTPLLHPAFTDRWFTWPNIALTSPVPILVALVAWLFWRGLSLGHHATPLLCAQAWFVLCYAGLGISLWPIIVPPNITIWDAAAPPMSQHFLLIGALILMPIILCYTGFAYWVFRGKVRPGMHGY